MGGFFQMDGLFHGNSHLWMITGTGPRLHWGMSGCHSRGGLEKQLDPPRGGRRGPGAAASRDAVDPAGGHDVDVALWKKICVSGIITHFFGGKMNIVFKAGKVQVSRGTLLMSHFANRNILCQMCLLVGWEMTWRHCISMRNTMTALGYIRNLIVLYHPYTPEIITDDYIPGILYPNTRTLTTMLPLKSWTNPCQIVVMVPCTAQFFTAPQFSRAWRQKNFISRWRNSQGTAPDASQKGRVSRVQHVQHAKKKQVM